VTFADELNAALRAVDAAKRKHPEGWRFLDEIGLPAEPLTEYAFDLARDHAPRLEMEDDIALVYAAGWLQGLGAGFLLGKVPLTSTLVVSVPRITTAVDLLRSALEDGTDQELRSAVRMALSIFNSERPDRSTG
jgi:hypothetical protein